MNHFPWSAVRRLAGGALCLLALSPHLARAQDLTLARALDAAWQRAVEATEAQGRQSRAEAEQAAARSWLAAPAALALSQRGGPAGARETELGLALPLLSPGQRAASGQAAEAEAAWARAATEAARLRLAGQLREAAAAVLQAEAEARHAEAQARLLGELAEDVDRRVKAGDLAPADALAARAEWLSATAQQRESRQALRARHSAWRLLTGFEQVPTPLDYPVMPTPGELPEGHPELRLSALALDLAQARAASARAQRPASPELSLGVRQDRPGQGVSTQNSVVLGLRLPFGGEAQRRPQVAAAQAELDLAGTQALRTRERLAAELALAHAQAEAALAQAQAERERAALLRERARLIDQSFRAGESALPELLRALAAATLAEGASARQQVELHGAQARLQQALGLLP